ncbi:sodium- and chloride-dependent glycine transporter 2-like [Diabrotica undecimpunctata]|uniref:sodium- and chloride-dependent glycine transporter 2-like n=1 Tax=Diabrotica undecimpunctata TaxID=50387 RepID=UPI003B6366B3
MKNKPKHELNERPSFMKWKSHTTYTIAILSWTMGLTNIFYIPTLILENGILDFFASHILVMIMVGLPVTVIDIAISQYSSKSMVRCWDICPFFRGAGYGKVIFIVLFQIYYNILNSYVLFYCFVPIPKFQNLNKDESQYLGDSNYDHSNKNLTFSSNTERFWYTEVIQFDRRLQYLDYPNMKLVGCLFGHTIIVLLLNFRGIDFLEAVLPFLLGLTIILFSTILLVTNTVSGAWNAIANLLSKGFNFNKLLLWRKEEIITDVFKNYLFSMGIAFGGFSSIAAQGSFRKPIYRTAIWANLINFLTSILYSFLFANFLEIIRYQEKNNREVQANHNGTDFYYIFTEIPTAFKYFPGEPRFWQLVFYIAIYIRGLCASALMTSTFLGIIYEERPKLYKHPRTCSLLFCVFIFLSGCFFHTNFGPIAGPLTVSIAKDIILPTMVTLQVISVLWIYGMLRFLEDLHFMLGFAPLVYWRVGFTLAACMVPLLSTKLAINYFANADLTSFEIVLEKFILSFTLPWVPFMILVRVIRKKKWKIILGPSTDWKLPINLESSRKVFQEIHCTQEYLYEKHLIQDKIKKYE